MYRFIEIVTHQIKENEGKKEEHVFLYVWCERSSNSSKIEREKEGNGEEQAGNDVIK